MMVIKIKNVKDWVGNKNSVFKTLGASNHTKEERETDDYYATDPKAAELLCSIEKLNDPIWEPCCGSGHLSKEFIRQGYNVYSTDLVNRGYGDDFFDFLSYEGTWDGDIVTNPPYKMGLEIIEKALSIVPDGRKVIMFMKVQFLEGKKRGIFFKRYPPKVIHVSSSRLLCAKNGDFEKTIANGGSAVAYAWWVWEKGYKGNTTIKWFN